MACIVADIGGTNARFALARKNAGKICIDTRQDFSVEDYPEFSQALNAYLGKVTEPLTGAVIAAAGPVHDGRIAMTNAQWQLDEKALQQQTGLQRVQIVNDFKATAAGIPSLTQEDILSIKQGTHHYDAPLLIVGPGTGLGQAQLVQEHDNHRVIATEGGHVSFLPANEDAVTVLRYLQENHDWVSAEHVLSGFGIVNIYTALCINHAIKPRFQTAAEISVAALAGDDAMAVRTLHVFCACLGAHVGDAVLSNGARGGVYLAGGILPKIKDFFLLSDFVKKFLYKGCMSNYVLPVPISLIVKDGAALYGAAALHFGDVK